MSGLCSVDGCWKPSKTKGMCRNHYAAFWRNGTTDKLISGDKRKHPFYHLWFERKQVNLLCEEWLDFKVFAEGVSPKPEGNFLLLRIDGSKVFSPDNFRWQEHLKKKVGESNKDWWKRKLEARKFANPSMERDRNIKRKYNLTREQYDEKLKAQNFVCEICGEKETSVARTGGIKNLAVDHNHITGKIRDLLCWRCNGTIGKLNENLELLDKMKQYLMKHMENE